MLKPIKEDEYYNEKYLNDKDKGFLKGFDYAVENVLDNIFDNLKTALSDVELERFFKKPAYEDLLGHYDVVSLDGKEERREIKTIGDYIRERFLDYAEVEREEVVTSLIDSMSEEEYAKIKDMVDKKE